MGKQRDLSALTRAKERKAEAAAQGRQDADVSMRQDADVKRKHFRVRKDLATRFAILAKERDTTETALLHEAIGLLFERYGVDVQR